MLHRVYLLSKKKTAPVPPVPPVPYFGRAALESTQTRIYDYYGRVVALNDSGTQLFVGSDENSNTNSPNITAGPGRVYVYNKTGTTWSTTPSTTLTASDGQINDSFGQSVAVSSDGKIVVVGAPNASVGGNVRQGAAYVFQWDPAYNNWVQTHKLTDTNGTAEDAFGYSVSISRDGTTIAVGANKDDIIPTYIVGSVYIYSVITLATGTATLAGDVLTVNTVLSANGLINVGSVITAPGIPPNTKVTQLLTGTGGIGTYRVSWSSPFTLNTLSFTASTTWSNPAKISASDSRPDDNFGCSIALSTTGNYLVVGSSGSDSATTPNTGAVYCYTRQLIGSTVTYNQVAKVVSNTAVPGQSFGFSVDLDTTGTTLLVGAPFYDNTVGEQDRGCVYLFRLTAAGWLQRLRLTSADGVAHDKFGWDVSVGTDGKYFCVGAPGCNAPIQECGATYVYVNLGTGWVQTAKLTEGALATAGDQFGYSTDITPDGFTVAVGAPTKGVSTGLPPPNTTRIHGATYVFSQ